MQMTDNPPVDRVAFLEAMSVLPGPVSLITTAYAGERMGLTASAVCSLSADPPSIIACVNKSASAHDMILKAGCFAVNILRPGQQDAATLFTRKEVDRFAGHDWAELSTGAPVLADALVAFDCRLDRAIDGFSHSILIGIVEQLSFPAHGDEESLIWHRRRYRGSADI